VEGIEMLEARGSKTRGFEMKGAGMTDMTEQYLKNTRAVEIANAKEMIKDLEGINVVQISTADAAFKRVKPLLDKLKDNLWAVARVIAREYDVLPKLEKKTFAERVQHEYGWGKSALAEYAQIGREFESKKKVIASAAADPKLDETSKKVMLEISRTPDATLKAAARAGMFDNKVSEYDIARFRKTGQLPRPKIASKPKTDLDKIRTAMVAAEIYITKASLKIGEITSIMEDGNITDAKGRETTALIRAFERLCTKMATANPTTSKRAFEMIRTGEWRQ